MSRNVRVVLLCEDQQQEVFARRFLKASGRCVTPPRVIKAPRGGGSAEQFVREQFPKELAAYRSRHYQEGQALVVILDGDDKGPAVRLRQLDEACQSKNITPRQGDERVAVFVPTWNIETWLAYLGGDKVDEGHKDYPRLQHERDCQAHVEALHQMCQAGALRPPAPASLEAACEECRSRLP